MPLGSSTSQIVVVNNNFSVHQSLTKRLIADTYRLINNFIISQDAKIISHHEEGSKFKRIKDI